MKIPALKIISLFVFLFAFLVFPFFAFADETPPSFSSMIITPTAGDHIGYFSSPFGVVVDSSGNIYVGDTNNNRIQKFDSSGAYLTQWGSSGTGNGQFSTLSGLAVDSSSNIYVADTNNYRIQKFDSSGAFLTKWGSSGSGNGQFDTPYGVTVDSSNNVYVADTGNARIQKFNSSGTFVTKWGSSGSANSQFNHPFGVSTDSSGNVYVADSYNHRIQKFNSSGTFVTKWGSSGTGNSQFSYPYGVRLDASNNVYVVDTNNHRIQKFNSSGTYVTQWGSSGSANSQFNTPQGITADSSNNVYVVDSLNNRIQEFNSSGTYLTKWVSSGNGNSQFNAPGGVAVDSSGNVYVADTSNQRIQKFDSSGTYLTKWGSSGSGNSQFTNPYGVAVDSSGNVYVADSNNSRIQKFDSSGTFVTKWGSSGTGNSQFGYPYGVAVDSSGNVYVAEYSNNRIQKFDSSGTYLTKWGSSGTGNSQFSSPYGLTVDSANNVYVADGSNNRIQKFDSSGAYLTQWGSLGTGNGQFSYPRGITTDSSGNIYVGDTNNNRIQKFDSSGAYLTQWGSLGIGNSQFNSPYGVTVDSSTGNFFVAEYNNHRIQKFTYGPPPTSPTIGTPTALSTTSIRWNFTDNASGETGFKVYDDSNILKVTCASADLAYCDETGLAANTSYTRKVVAYNSLNSAYSSTATISTPAGTPTAPTIGTPSVLSTTSIRWTFTDNASNETGFKVYDNGTPTLMVTCATADLTYCDETGLSVNTTYTRKVVAYNGSGNSGYTSTATAYTLANAPGTPSVTPVTATTETVVVAVNSNPSGTEFAIQETGSGNYVSKSTGALGAISWGTYAEWGSGTGVTVTGLSAGTNYTFQIKARNGDLAATTFGNTASARTKSLVQSLPVSVASVVLATDDTTDVTSSSNAQTGSKTVRLKKTGGIRVVDFPHNFDSGNLSLTGVSMDSDATLKKAFVTGVATTHTLYIPKGASDNLVVICPNATNLSEVVAGCSGYINGYDGYNSNGITVSISGSYWVVAGLTGTGGFSSYSAQNADNQLRQKISTLSTHLFTFNLSGSTTFAAGDTMIFTFKNLPGTGTWTFPTDVTWVTGDFSFNDGTARTITSVGASPTCNAGANNVSVTTSQSGLSLTVTACTSYTTSNSGAPITFTVGTARITNPEVAGSYEIWLSGTFGDLQTEFEVPIMNDDQVSVSGSVDTYMAFNATTSSGSDNTINLGELGFAAVTSSNDSARTNQAGTALPTDNVSISLDTNAYGGTVVQVKSANGGLKSTVAGNYTLTSATETLAINQTTVSGTAGYGLQAQTASTTQGTLTNQTPYNGSSNAVGLVDSTFRTIYATPTNSTSAPIVGGTASIYVMAVPAQDTPAADDYTDTLTFRATSTY